MPYGEQTGQSLTRPPPIGGWNARDSLASMPPEDAFQLDNWFPGTDRVESRKGPEAHATLTGITTDVDTLAAWNGPTGKKLWAFACAAGAKRAFDCSTSGAKAADAAFTALGFTGNMCQYTTAMFNNTAGYYLYLTDNNGDHAPAHYNGTTWVAPALTGTGLTASNLAHVALFKFRLFFIERNTLNLWYLPLDAIAGTLTRYSLGGFFNEGGSLVASASWSMDAGDGPNDQFVVVTDEGQLALFAGTNPSSASSWQIVTVVKCAPPIGRNCFLRLGRDLHIITTDGLFPVAALFDQSGGIPLAMSDKIRSAFQQSAATWGSEASGNGIQPGWAATYYPLGRYIMVNVPQHAYGTAAAGSRPMYQFVMNAQTKQWTRFTGQDGRSFAVFNDHLYYGTTTGGAVVKADSVNSDLGQPIPLRCRQAFDYFDTRGRNKQFTLARPLFRTDSGSINGNIYIDTDFDESNITSAPATLGGTGSAWDTSPWDTTGWDPNELMVKDWQTYGGIGFCASLVVYVGINGASLSWYATDWLFIVGGVL